MKLLREAPLLEVGAVEDPLTGFLHIVSSIESQLLSQLLGIVRETPGNGLGIARNMFVKSTREHSIAKLYVLGG